MLLIRLATIQLTLENIAVIENAHYYQQFQPLKFLGVIFGTLVLLFIALIIVVSIVDPVPATTAHSPQAEAPTHIAAHATTVPAQRHSTIFEGWVIHLRGS